MRTLWTAPTWSPDLCGLDLALRTGQPDRIGAEVTDDRPDIVGGLLEYGAVVRACHDAVPAFRVLTSLS
jgi:hypothetical protein